MTYKIGVRNWKKLLVLSFLIYHMNLASTEESFLLMEGRTKETVLELGPYLDRQISPCSTFKITLALIGYDTGILIDESTPTWDFHDGYDDWLASWKAPQSPQSWMHDSCVWYSKVLSYAVGEASIQRYVTLMNYGNKDMSGGLTQPGAADPAWINSSLAISPREQVDFLQNMLLETLPVSAYATQMTKNLLFKETLPNSWQLFGKTGWSGSNHNEEANMLEHAWFVGWVEKEDRYFSFAYLIRDKHIRLDQRVPRVKQLLHESNIMHLSDNTQTTRSMGL